MAAITPRNLEQLLAAERMRISAIIEGEEGRKRPMLALELALRSPVSVDAANALLAKAAVESRAGTAAESFARALQAEAIGVTSLNADGPIDDPKAKRLREIKRNVGKKGQRND